MFHTKPCDPLGLILPTWKIGDIIFCKILQSMKKESKGGIPWDEKIKDEHLQEKLLNYLEILLEIGKIKFCKICETDWWPVHQCHTYLNIFGDSNPDSFRSVAYAVFGMENGDKNLTCSFQRPSYIP